MRRLLRNARLVDPVSGVDGKRDLLIVDGKVTRVEPGIVDGKSRMY